MIITGDDTSKMKASFRCEEEFKPHFRNSHCLLTISVGLEVHENIHFKKTIQMISDNFAKCTICVDDSLQRHSMGLSTGTKPEDCYGQAVAEGDSWILRNENIYDQLKIPYEVIRWDKWLFNKEYSRWYTRITEEYDTNEEYRNEIEFSITEFLKRYARRLPDNVKFDYEYARKVCRDYLFEECSALCLWAEEGYQFEVYPNKRNSAMTATHDNFIKPHSNMLVNAVAIKFRNFKQLRAQSYGAASQIVSNKIAEYA